MEPRSAGAHCKHIEGEVCCRFGEWNSYIFCLLHNKVGPRSAGAHCKHIEGEACCRFGEWNLKDVDFLNQVQLITAKPVVYLVNLPEKMYIKKKSKWLPKV